MLRPDPGELLSSWVARIAQLNYETPYETAVRLLESKRIGLCDIDRHADSRLIGKIESQLGLERNAMSPLFRFRTLSDNDQIKAGIYPGWLAVGVWGRERRLHGLQYCSPCLEESSAYQGRWRFALLTTCPKHGTPLRDACPACANPIALHHPRRGELWRCFHCTQDIRRSGTKLASTAEHELSQQVSRDFEQHYVRGCQEYLSNIALLRCVWGLLDRSPAGARLAAELSSGSARTTQQSLERSRLDVRRHWLPILMPDAAIDISKITKALMRAQITRRRFLHGLGWLQMRSAIDQVAQKLQETPGRSNGARPSQTRQNHYRAFADVDKDALLSELLASTKRKCRISNPV